MERVRLDTLPIVGALDRDVHPSGIVLRRLPAWTRPQLLDPALALLVTMPAGVRIEMLTDARDIELDVMLTVVQVGDVVFPAPTFDLVADGSLRSSSTAADFTTILVDPHTDDVDVRIGRPATVRFDLAGDPTIPIEIWLPHGAVVELREVRVSPGATVHRAPHSDRRWVHYGSSISHCLEAAHPTGTWPATAARMAGVDLMNLAVAGQCMLDQHVARTIRDLDDVDFISVKAGINVVNGDSMRERTYVAALHGFLDTIRDGHPTTPLAVITPIICPEVEDHPGPTMLGDDHRFHVVPRARELSAGSLSLRRIRELMAQIVTTRRDTGDANLYLIDGLTLFGPDDADDLPDGLHPNAEGYRRIGERFHSRAFSDAGPFARTSTGT